MDWISDQAGFTIVIPQGVQNFDLMCQAPGTTMTRHINVQRLMSRFRMQYISTRVHRLMFYAAHLGNREAMKDLRDAVRRRVVGETDFTIPGFSVMKR